MDDPTLAYEDMLFFERRLTEVISSMQPKVKKWRIVLTIVFLSTLYNAYFWIFDSSIKFITLWESLLKHPLFTISFAMLLFLFLICGVHKRVVAPKMFRKVAKIISLRNSTRCLFVANYLIIIAKIVASTLTAAATTAVALTTPDTEPHSLQFTKTTPSGLDANNNRSRFLERLRNQTLATSLFALNSTVSAVAASAENANSDFAQRNSTALDSVGSPQLAATSSKSAALPEATNAQEVGTHFVDTAQTFLHKTISSIFSAENFTKENFTAFSESSAEHFSGVQQRNAVPENLSLLINSTLYNSSDQFTNLSYSPLQSSQPFYSNTTESMLVIDQKSMELLPLAELPGMLLLALSMAFMVIGGAIPYVFQYIEIYKRKSAVGFSLLVCLALCLANILRILFWFGKRFETTLLVQSVVMILCMVGMLEISVRMNKKVIPPMQRTSVWKGDFHRAFWKWNDLSSFIFTLILITVVASIITAIFQQYKFYVEALGMMALLVEACLGLPQLLRNFKRRSVTGMSVKMVLMWLLGDLGKTIYFVVRQNPSQFYICSCLQITIDILILLQVFFYGKRSNESTRVPTFVPNNPKI